jgi:2,4-dienoyl-CoA reductase-like NADH-dependent reductase (Old Yellow Enzyme family)
MSYPRVATLKTPADLRAHLGRIGATLPLDDTLLHGSASPLAQPWRLGEWSAGNRIAVLPMEGWDGTADGHPSDLTIRRWQRFGLSGAKLIWGGEAVAVRHDGRANARQLVAKEDTLAGLAGLRETLIRAHEEHFSTSSDLLIGLQLTHSGRFCKPNDDKRIEPQILYRHPWLDRKYKLAPDLPLLSDDDIARLIEDFGRAARIAQRAGYAFVDLKHCHGYLGHEFLSAIGRPGRYGGSFENRTRFLREASAAIRAAAPGIGIAVRLSAFDWMPFKGGAGQTGEPDRHDNGAYRYAFGGDASGTGIDLREPLAFLDQLAALDISMVCITAGSPYYNPHIQRPALFPPSDGYLPPEDPLCGVARQIGVVAQLKRARPNLLYVGSGYSYLQEWLPNVAQAAVREGMVDVVGLGRMVLTYPEILVDAIAGKTLARKRLCRTFSDCTTGPRNGLVSGCYPLDEFYKNHPQHAALKAAKEGAGV